MPRLPSPFSTRTLRSISFLSGASLTNTKSRSSMDQPFPISIRPYTPHDPNGLFPYSAQDMTPMDSSEDSSFYRIPRFVTHIDDNAIIATRRYYDLVLPKESGSKILDFCSSWVSHYPPSVEEASKKGEIVVFGTGMNKSELSQNAVLRKWWIQDLNVDPEVKVPATEGVANDLSAGKAVAEENDASTVITEHRLDAATCVVSIDYLTSPVAVLQSIRNQTNPNGKVHLVISNRCFPTKVVGRWLKVGENERLEMVGDYLWWSGWRDIEIVTLVQGSWMKDPLWVVRGTNTETRGST